MYSHMYNLDKNHAMKAVFLYRALIRKAHTYSGSVCSTWRTNIKYQLRTRYCSLYACMHPILIKLVTTQIGTLQVNLVLATKYLYNPSFVSLHSHLYWRQIEEEVGISCASVCNWPGDADWCWSDGSWAVIEDGGVESHLSSNAPEISDCSEISRGACEGDKLATTGRSDGKQEVKKQEVWRTGSGENRKCKAVHYTYESAHYNKLSSLARYNVMLC